jgi:RNA 3'-terminal phosphate cyclase
VFRARSLTAHARTVLWLLEQFLAVRASTQPAGACTRVEL